MRRVISILIIGALLLLPAFGQQAAQQMLVSQGGGFSPASISGLRLWLKADSLALNDGDAVATWADSSGNSNAATQATSSKRPLYKVGIQNSLAAVLFDGTDDVLTANSLAATFTGNDKPSTVVMVFRKTSNSGSQAFFSFGNSGLSSNYHYLFITGGAYNEERSSGGVAARSGGTPDTSAHIISNVFTGTALSVLIDGSAVINNQGFDTASITFDQFALGALARISMSEFLAGYLMEVAVYDSALSTTDRQSVESYLKTKWGTP